MTDPFFVDPSTVASCSTPISSSSSSSAHHDSAPSSTPRRVPSFASESSDDEDGVFFGAHDPQETDFVAKLSAVRSPDPIPSLHRRQSATRIVRLRKRDSREFLRRKTLLISGKGNVDEECEAIGSPKDKASLLERPSSEGSPRFMRDEPQDLPCSPHSPSRLSGSSDAAAAGGLDLQGDETDSFGEGGSDHDALSMDESSSASDSEGLESDSDKENVMVMGNGAADNDDLELGAEQDPTVTLGMGALAISESEDALPGLDLGGLCLDDFADPDVTAAAEIIAIESDYESESDDLSLSQIGSIEEDLEREQLPAADSESCGLRVSPDRSQELAICDEEDSVELGRGGPVVIPHISHFAVPIRAETASPFRRLPSLPLSPVAFAEEPQELHPLKSDSSIVMLSSIDDTKRPSPSKSHGAGIPVATPSVGMPARVLVDTTTPVSKTAAVLPGNKATKVLKPLGLSVAKNPVDKAGVAARVMSIRGQLDAVVATKMSSMGPPQRSVSSSSAASSSTSAPARSKPKPTIPKPPTMMRPEGQRKVVVARVPSAPPLASSTVVSHAPVDQRSAKAVVSRPLAFGRQVTKSTGIVRPGVASKATLPSASKLPQVGVAHTSAVRPALAARSTVAPPLSARPALNGPGHLQPRPLAASATSSTFLKTRPISPVEQPANPLKRPFSASHTNAPRSVISVGGGAVRPTLGLPARVVRDASGAANFQTLSMGSTRDIGGAAVVNGTPMSKSPGRIRRAFLDGSSRLTPSSARVIKLGTPSRAAGTPRRFAVAALSASSPTKSGTGPADSAEAEPDPPAKHTRSSEEPDVETRSSPTEEVAVERGSSEDHQDVSFQLGAAPSSTPPTSPPSSTSSHPSSPSQSAKAQSPKRSSPKRNADASSPSKIARPRRASKPSAPPAPARARSRPPQTIVPSIAPNMSEKELKTATQRNTMRNQVYHCAIDRQIVRKTGPRPPSPTSKMRTTFDKSEERKQARGDRAKRRAQESDGSQGHETQDEHEPIVIIERPRGPGDDPDYKTPARPAKRAKVDREAPSEKYVSWDSSLVLIRDDGESRPGSAAAQAAGTNEEPAKSCLRQDSKVSLDQHGNVVETGRPKEDLKRARIVVTAVFYDGEEPLPVAYPSSTTGAASASGKGKKKA